MGQNWPTCWLEPGGVSVPQLVLKRTTIGRGRSSSYFFYHSYIVMGSVGSMGSIGSIGIVLTFLRTEYFFTAMLACPQFFGPSRGLGIDWCLPPSEHGGRKTRYTAVYPLLPPLLDGLQGAELMLLLTLY
jgi:hypothetical protein